MFIYHYFKRPVQSITNIFELRAEKFIKVIFFFLLLNIILSFPANLNLIVNRGMNFEQFGLNLREDIPDWFPNDLPSDCMIVSGSLTCKTTTQFVRDYNDFKFVIDPNSTYINTSDALVFRAKKIEFMKGKSKQEFSYDGYSKPLVFGDLIQKDKTYAADRIMSGIENEFSTTSTLFGMGIYTLYNISMNLIYLLIVTLLAMTLKFAHKSFVSYKEMLTMFIFSSTLPTLICFIFGLIVVFMNSSANIAFLPLIYQFGTPIIFLLMYYRVMRYNLACKED